MNHMRFRSPHLLNAVAICTVVLASGTSTKAAELLCHYYSDRNQLLETLRITRSSDNTLNVWSRKERTSIRLETEENDEKVVFNYFTTHDGLPDSPKFSVFGIEQTVFNYDRNIKMVLPPKIYLVDWGNGKLAEVGVPFVEPLAFLDLRWECGRVD
jgi:hypothetical protein